MSLPISTASLLNARKQRLQPDSMADTVKHRPAPETPDVWINTSQRRSSIARLSLMMKMLPAYLIYYSENGAAQRIDLTKEVYTVGRKHGNDIVLQCPQISKDHAHIERTSEGWYIHDHQSANGIMINDEPMQVLVRRLKDRDRIQLGSVSLEFFDEVEITPDNASSLVNNHPAFSSQLGQEALSEAASSVGVGDDILDVQSDVGPVLTRPTSSTSSGHAVTTTARSQTLRPRRGRANKNFNDLVTILPSDEKYEEVLTVRAEMSAEEDRDNDFRSAEEVNDVETLKNDYEKLRLAYELSKLGLTDVEELIEKMLDLMFEVLPVDRGVVMLVDRKTGMLTTDNVRLRAGKGQENREILVSSTVLHKVYKSKKCLITSDAFEDPLLGKAKSIARGQIRSVICVPMIAHDKVQGILHLDSQDRINSFAEKDLSLVKAIANQAAIALENCQLVKDIEEEVAIRENLGRFLPPHVVDRAVASGEEPIRKGGRMTTGTILFADIRGFTEMSERLPAQAVVDLLNDFFERLVQIVFKYDGVLDKYIGDCLMAGFGTLTDDDSDKAVHNAVCAAVEFKIAIAEMNAERSAQGKEAIEIGVGLNTGHLVAGFIGSSQRLEYTSIGDTVNTASRICSMAKANQVLISQSTYERVQGKIQAKFYETRVFKGKSTECDVYEVAGIL